MNNYEINPTTMVLFPLSDQTSKVVEEEENKIISQSVNNIIDYSCRYFGSSYIGRCEGTKTLLGYDYKLPIMIDEFREIIFFPICSPRLKNCIWVSLHNIVSFEAKEKQTLVIFKNNKKFLFPISYRSFENQVLRANLLYNVMKNRRK